MGCHRLRRKSCKANNALVAIQREHSLVTKCLFMQLIDELLPVVPGAPNLGGHNRSGESMKALKAKQKLQQSQPGGEAGRRAAAVAGALPGNVAQMPSAGLMHNSLAAPREATWEQGPLLGRGSVSTSHKVHVLSAQLLTSQGPGLCKAMWQ